MFFTLVEIRILILGREIILFAIKTEKYIFWKDGLANFVGKLYIDYDILDHQQIIAITIIGSFVAEKIKKGIVNAVIGLQLKFANRTIVITIVILGFIKLLG